MKTKIIKFLTIASIIIVLAIVLVFVLSSDKNELKTRELVVRSNVLSDGTELGTVLSEGSFNIGETITLTATPNSENNFMAWATSTDPKTMEILSTSSTYTFKLEESSPKNYYALFNSASNLEEYTSQSEEDAGIIYTLYKDAGLAIVSGANSYVTTAILPSIILNNKNNIFKVYSIENYAFSDCTSLKSISISDGIISIGKGAFYNCSELKNVKLSNSIKSIEQDTFYNCNNLTMIEIPNSVTHIGNTAFVKCSMLTSINIPSNVNTIGYASFANCSELSSITFENGLIGIGYLAFQNCNKLTSIKLPSSLKLIGFHAFFDCIKLETIIIEAENPPTLEINAIPDNIVSIYVPSGSIDIYKSAKYWNEYEEKIHEISQEYK